MKIYLNRRILCLLTLLVGVLIAGISTPPSAIAAGQSVPLTGRFQGAGEHFSGNMTHLGTFQGVIDNSVVPPTAVWTAANGDTITNQTVSFEIDLSSPIGPNLYPYTQEIDITGGTGRFMDATGHAHVTGVINMVTFEYDGRLQGHLSKPHHRP